MALTSAVVTKPADEIVGTTEIARLLGLSAGRVDQLSRQKDFPDPIPGSASGRRAWRMADIRQWAALTGRLAKD